MPQVVNGIQLVGGVYIFVNAGAPAQSPDPLVASANPASLYLRTDTGVLYVKATDGTWTQK